MPFLHRCLPEPVRLARHAYVTLHCDPCAEQSQEAMAMPVRSITSAALLAAAVSLSLVFGSSGARAYDCEEQVNEALTEHGISQDEVRSVKVVRRSAGARSSAIHTLAAWVRLNSCNNGALAVCTPNDCMVQRVYTTGGCRVEGVTRNRAVVLRR